MTAEEIYKEEHSLAVDEAKKFRRLLISYQPIVLKAMERYANQQSAILQAKILEYSQLVNDKEFDNFFNISRDRHGRIDGT